MCRLPRVEQSCPRHYSRQFKFARKSTLVCSLPNGIKSDFQFQNSKQIQRPNIGCNKIVFSLRAKKQNIIMPPTFLPGNPILDTFLPLLEQIFIIRYLEVAVDFFLKKGAPTHARRGESYWISDSIVLNTKKSLIQGLLVAKRRRKKCN